MQELKELQILEVQETTEKVDMYDLEVEGNHNYFLGNGVLTHNSLNLLKSATETEEKRVLTKSNYSKQQADLPDAFICKSKFVFDYNSLQSLRSDIRDDFEALVTRGDFVELSICEEEIQKLMFLIAVEPWQKEVTKFLINHFRETGHFRLNLRTQWKAFKTYQYAEKNKLDWKNELKAELNNVGRIRSLLYGLIGNKVVKTKELKKMLLRYDIVTTLRTADNRIKDWLFLEELHKVSEEERNFLVCIHNIREKKSSKDLNKS